MLNRVKVAAERLSTLAVGTERLQGATRSLSVLAGDIRLSRFLALAGQLALVLLVIYQFRIEEASGLLQITGVLFLGFIVHSWLARPLRLPFFVLLSMIAIEAVFGVVNAMWLIGIGLALIGLCHLPIAFWMRVALILCAAAGLASLQAGWFETSWSGIILPILGSMFMFRLIIYLYDLRHEKTPASVWERLSYFFLLPNVCFPLFPVVDYQLFRRTYYNDDAGEIYQKGVLWIFRGVTHLLLYRLIYYYATPSPSEVQGLAEVVQYVVTSYLLYLRVSGLFHMIIGILCLFGFNLPETHHLYFFASGFNDVWRRLNIYWKDFMVKIFYYPVLMRARRWGMTPARVMATGVVFLATWLLHSYQWFWLQGAFPVTAVDGLYWGLLGGLVIVNTLYVARQLKQPAHEEPAWTWTGALVHATKVVGMFVVMSVLWSFWSSASVSEWVATVSTAGDSGWTAYLWLLAGLGGLLGGGVVVQYLIQQGWWVSVEDDSGSLLSVRPGVYTSVAASLLLLASVPQGQQHMGERGAAVMASIQESRLNQRDLDRMERGYYEGLLDAENNHTSELWWAVEAHRPRDWKPLYDTEAVRPGEGVFEYELKPSYAGIQKQAPFRTNQWGMRDREYAKEKPPQTVRIALLGASIEMGAGVKGEETYQALLEERLNAEYGGTERTFEVLNFAVGAYSVIQNVAMLEEKVVSFAPDLVLYAVGSTEERRLLVQMANLIQQRRPLPDKLREIVDRAQVGPGIGKLEIRKRLTPYVGEIIQWGFTQFSATCGANDIPPVLVYVPNTNEIDNLDRKWSSRLVQYAQDAGFAILNLEGAYNEHDREAIRLAPWDWHLSVTGHRLIADRLYRALQENHALLGLEYSSDDATRVFSAN